jgi:peptidyl-dipeptidase Dcp
MNFLLFMFLLVLHRKYEKARKAYPDVKKLPRKCLPAIRVATEPVPEGRVRLIRYGFFGILHPENFFNPMTKILASVFLLAALAACTQTEKHSTMADPGNPFFEEFDTPFGVPPFDRIHHRHFMPAYQAALEAGRQEIAAIAGNPDEPTFDNTLAALERSGKMLTRVSSVFGNLSGSMTNDSIQQIQKEVSPLLTRYRDDIRLNGVLFARIKSLYERRESLGLNAEQNQLLEEYYSDFVRGGANLAEESKEEFRKINEELSLLSIRFGDNNLKDINRYQLVVDAESDLAGLPDGVKSEAARAAAEAGHAGKWLFTIQKPSMIPLLQYAEKRDLREQIYRAYIDQGRHGDSLDNREVLKRISELRIRRANLLGYPTHAHFVLERNMAGEPDQVYELLKKLWTPAQAVARKEARSMQAIIDAEGGGFKLQPWDWWYYAEKVKKKEYDLDEESLRPYFALENVRQGIHYVANRLYGITLQERTDIPVYHPEVRTFEVLDRNGGHVGILMTDYHPRGSKRSGAWMNSFRKQSRVDGDVRPVIVNVGNFTRPGDDRPALLSLDETLTMFHEFGHGLHGLMSDCTYPSLSGTSVPRDFVELFSQIMENWALEPDVLKIYAKHYETGEVIPDELVSKIQKSRKFNQGFATVEYLAASFLDMDWHTLSEPTALSADEFEKQSLEAIGLIPEIAPRYHSPYFRHVFSGGYSSGYYSYIWAEVLDQDAFAFISERDLFDQERAASFLSNLLSRGGTDDAMTMYRRFRGKDPDIRPLLVNRGLDAAPAHP